MFWLGPDALFAAGLVIAGGVDGGAVGDVWFFGDPALIVQPCQTIGKFRVRRDPWRLRSFLVFAGLKLDFPVCPTRCGPFGIALGLAGSTRARPALTFPRLCRRDIRR